MAGIFKYYLPLKKDNSCTRLYFTGLTIGSGTLYFFGAIAFEGEVYLQSWVMPPPDKLTRVLPGVRIDESQEYLYYEALQRYGFDHPSFHRLCIRALIQSAGINDRIETPLAFCSASNCKDRPTPLVPPIPANETEGQRMGRLKDMENWLASFRALPR